MDQRGAHRGPRTTVLYLSHTGAWGGGAEVVLEQLIVSARVAGYSPHLVGPRGTLMERLGPQCNGATVISMPWFHRTMNPLIGVVFALRWLISAARLGHTIIRTQSDLVHANSGVAALAACVPAYLCGRRLVWHQHDIVPDRTVNRMALRMCSKLCAGIIATSRAVRDSLVELGIEEHRIFVLHPSVRRSFLSNVPCKSDCRAALGISSEVLVLSVIGRLVARKGQKIMLEALPELLVGGLDVQCLLLGGAPDDTDSAGVANAYANELHLLARQPLLRDRVTLLPYSDDIRVVLAASDILVVPSLAEPFGIVILEAFACGVPVVASAVAGPLELIEDGETGILVTPGQAHALAEGIRRLSTDLELRDHVSTRAREQVKAYFSEDVFTARVRTIYSSVLRRKTAVCDERTAP